MTVHVVGDDPTVAFQDGGTGAIDYNDPASAGLWSGSYWEGGFVHHGMEVTVGTGEINVNRGVAFLQLSGHVDVQTETRGLWDREWYGPSVFPVSLPTVTGMSLDANEENELWVHANLSNPNHVEYHLGFDISAPGEPSLHVATIDESSGDVTRHNDWKSAESRYNPRDVRNMRVGPGEVGVHAYHDGSGGYTEGPAIWRGDKWVSKIDSTTIGE